jgi:hypothetical protein
MGKRMPETCWAVFERRAINLRDHDQLHCYHHVPTVNDRRLATAVYKLLMMGKRVPETCWAVFERRTINLRNWCIWLVDLFEIMYNRYPKNVEVERSLVEAAGCQYVTKLSHLGDCTATIKECELQVRCLGPWIHHQRRVRAFLNTDCPSRLHTLMPSVIANGKFEGTCQYYSQFALQYNTVPWGVMRVSSEYFTTAITADLRVKAL